MATITDRETLLTQRAYDSALQAAQHAMSFGVYPNCQAALRNYDALEAWLIEHPDYAETHNTIVGDAAQFITALRGHMQEIIIIMQAIEAAQPGTFGIQLPEKEEDIQL